MPASRLDIEWERGGDWEIVVGRRTRRDVVLPAVAGSMEVREIDAPSSTPALVTIVGSITDEHRVRLRASAEQMEPLLARHYEHRILITDQLSERRLITLRGYLEMIDNVGDG